jgi:hypothetical protein
MHRTKIAVVATGWHFPLHFYETMAKQNTDDIEVELFCVSHRDPIDDKHAETLGDSRREKIDKILYKEIATEEKIKALGWHYKLYPNTIGDWGCSNQWLEDNDYKQYDILLFTHDDNFILKDTFLKDVANNQEEWLILSNSNGVPAGWLRGSCEFFKKEMLDKMNGKFDLSKTKLNREGKTDNPADKNALNDWNTTVYPLMKFIADNNIPVFFLSDTYRVSPYCIEGERGWIHYTQGLGKGINTALEERGFDKIGL